MPAFSVIVPIYNAEKTLDRCLSSLREQRFSDFEVLMIENGSSDASNDICRTYAFDDSRFLLHTCEKNTGPSGARNIGLEQVCGEWVVFVDSDDYVTPDYLEQLQRVFTAKYADGIFFGYRQIDVDGTEIAVRVPRIPEKATHYEILASLSKQDMFGYTWIKAFRTDLIGETRFPVKLNLMEDEVFTCKVLEQGCHIEVLPVPLYYYVTGNASSLVGRTHQDYCTKLDAAYCAWKKLLAGSPDCDGLLREKANSHVSKCMYYGFERDVDPDDFFRNLAQCNFFADSNLETAFYLSVKTGKLRKLRQMRSKYRLKVTVSKLLKR